MATTETTWRKHRTPASTPKLLRSKKFMQTLSLKSYRTLETVGRRRGVSVQELLRAQIIPDWLTANLEEDR